MNVNFQALKGRRMFPKAQFFMQTKHDMGIFSLKYIMSIDDQIHNVNTIN